MQRRESENLLARAAWLLADMRAYLQTLQNSDSKALVHRCDAYFEETYSYLKRMDAGSRATSVGSAPSVEISGADLRGREITTQSPGSARPTPRGTGSAGVSLEASSGGRPSVEKMGFVDFF